MNEYSNTNERAVYINCYINDANYGAGVRPPEKNNDESLRKTLDEFDRLCENVKTLIVEEYLFGTISGATDKIQILNKLNEIYK